MTSSKFKFSRFAWGALLFGTLANLSTVGCSDDTSANGGAGEGNGNTSDRAASWIAGGWISQDDAWYGVLNVVDDLSSDATYDLDTAVPFEGDFTFTGYGGAVYVGLEAQPVIEKWEVDDAGLLQKVDTVSFEAYGVVETFGASHTVIQIVDDETGWYFDHDSAKVYVFDPSDMSTDGVTYDYSAIYEGLDFDANDWPDIGDTSRFGDYVVVPMFWYDGTDDTIPLETRIALVSTEDGSVTIAKDTRCAGSNVISNDGDGNVYFGPHAAASLWWLAGEAGDAVPCIIRIKAGETEVDQDYLVEFPEISGGKAVSSLFQGPGNSAYVYQYEGTDTAASARFTDDWTLYRIELGADDPEYTKVAGWPSGNGTGIGFNLRVGEEQRFYLTSTTEEGAKSAYYELLADGSVEEGLNFTIFPGQAVNY